MREGMFRPLLWLRRCAAEPTDRGSIPEATAAFQTEAKSKAARVSISRLRGTLHVPGVQN